MEKAFSTKWVSSKQPRKQRKYRHNAPLHIRSHFLHSHLSKELRTKHGARAIRVRTGDEVKVMRGQFAGKTGKVERVDTIHTRIFVTGIDQVKRDGTKKLYPLQPSNVMIIKVTDDKRRFISADKEKSKPAKESAPKKETQKPQTAEVPKKPAAKKAVKA